MGTPWPTTPLTYDQIKSLWIQEGGPANYASTMAGVAMFESGGGYPNALAGMAPSWVDTNDQPSVGLWQINGVHAPGGSTTWNSAWSYSFMNPDTNAKYAVGLFANGAGIGNWLNDPVANAQMSQGLGTPLSDSQVTQILARFGLSTGGTSAPYNYSSLNTGTDGSNINAMLTSFDTSTTGSISGVGKVLQGIDSFLNPTGSTVLNVLSLGTSQVIVVVVYRAIASVLFIGIIFFGVSSLTKGGTASTLLRTGSLVTRRGELAESRAESATRTELQRRRLAVQEAPPIRRSERTVTYINPAAEQRARNVAVRQATAAGRSTRRMKFFI